VREELDAKLAQQPRFEQRKLPDRCYHIEIKADDRVGVTA
jgi:hypothetical protein